MFSTNQIEVLSALIPTMKDKGFDFYVAYTSTNTNSGWGASAIPDLYVVFSQDKIEASSGYDYIIPEGSCVYTIRTANYSTSDYGVNTDRFVLSEFSGVLSIDVYEHIYSNAEYLEGSVIMPDFNYRGVGEQYEKTNGLGIVVTIVLLFVVFCSFFKR